ncbi:MAG: hypothetical protein IRZ15_15165 [Bryobacteraceae bacterium]|jgi:hypothetical protein|nr:hypothetical protein [Bryobacteraceae bacterium]
MNWITVALPYFLAFVLGAASSLCIVVLVEWLRKPRLCLAIAPPRDQAYPAGYPASKVRFLEVSLRNKPLPSWLRWMSRSSASSCRATIDFLKEDGTNIFTRSMAARWSASPQPVPLQFRLGDNVAQILDVNRLNMASVIDVPPGESESMGVVGRFDENTDCFGWSNESYFSNPPWRNPDWKLSIGRYLIRITVRASGEKCSELFWLINAPQIADVRLEPHA